MEWRVGGTTFPSPFSPTLFSVSLTTNPASPPPRRQTRNRLERTRTSCLMYTNNPASSNWRGVGESPLFSIAPFGDAVLPNSAPGGLPASSSSQFVAGVGLVSTGDPQGTASGLLSTAAVSVPSVSSGSSSTQMIQNGFHDPNSSSMMLSYPHSSVYTAALMGAHHSQAGAAAASFAARQSAVPPFLNNGGAMPSLPIAALSGGGGGRSRAPTERRR